MAMEEMQDKIKKLRGDGAKTTISSQTARQWMNVLNWRSGKKKRGMYIDGHEGEYVVEYRRTFVERWKKQYEPRMVLYGDDGGVQKTLRGFTVLQGVRFQLMKGFSGQNSLLAKL